MWDSLGRKMLTSILNPCISVSSSLALHWDKAAPFSSSLVRQRSWHSQDTMKILKCVEDCRRGAGSGEWVYNLSTHGLRVSFLLWSTSANEYPSSVNCPSILIQETWLTSSSTRILLLKLSHIPQYPFTVDRCWYSKYLRLKNGFLPQKIWDEMSF